MSGRLECLPDDPILHRTFPGTRMKTNPSNSARWSIVVLFAVAMAWVESAVVYYLRTMIDRIDPYQPNPLPVIGGLGPVELTRELATLIMLLAVGALAGQTWRRRLGYSALAFGVWDISYYVFLKLMCGWPHSLLDWDILFLLPLPWWGPVLAPVLIALLLIAWGTLASQFEPAHSSGRANVTVLGMNLAGITLALYVFMADSIRVAGQGVETIRNILPAQFHWPLFVVALGLMAAPVLRLGGQLPWRQQLDRAATEAAARLPRPRSPQN